MPRQQVGAHRRADDESEPHDEAGLAQGHQRDAKDLAAQELDRAYRREQDLDDPAGGVGPELAWRIVRLRRLGGGEPGRLVALQYTEVLRHALDEGGINRGLVLELAPRRLERADWHYVCLAGCSRVGVPTMP